MQGSRVGSRGSLPRKLGVGGLKPQRECQRRRGASPRAGGRGEGEDSKLPTPTPEVPVGLVRVSSLVLPPPSSFCHPRPLPPPLLVSLRRSHPGEECALLAHPCHGNGTPPPPRTARARPGPKGGEKRRGAPPSPADTPRLPWLPQQPGAFRSAQPRSGKGLCSARDPSPL